MTAGDLHNPADPSPPPALVIVDRYVQPAGYAVNRPQGADSWLITFTTNGSGHFQQGQTTVRAEPGDLIVLGPRVSHRYSVAKGASQWTFWWAHCQARPAWSAWLQPYLQGDRLYSVGGVPAEVRVRIDKSFRRMAANARWSGLSIPPEPDRIIDRTVVAHSNAARELALCAMEEVILLAAVTARATAADRRADGRVQRAQALMAADPSAPHTVASLAASVSISPSRLAHLFTAHLGQTPMQVLREARLAHATQLLHITDLPVERIAAASGFASATYFSRVFRQHYGLAPGAFRAAQNRAAHLP